MSNKSVYQFDNASAEAFVMQVRSFLDDSSPQIRPKVPPVINIRLTMSRKLVARVANRLAVLPLRIVRKSTRDYWLAQQQLDYEFVQDIKLLNTKINELQKKVRELEAKYDTK